METTSTKTKFQIKNRFTGNILFEYESETLKDTVVKAIESDADLSGAYLSGANLRGADLTPIKNDLFVVLLHAIHEIPNLKKAIIEGKIDGSTYTGDCACLSGTVHKAAIENNGPQQKQREDLIMACRDSSRPIEMFFCGISPGHTPENNQAAKLVMDWIEEFESLLK